MLLHSRTSSGSKFSITDIQLESGPPERVSFDGSIVKICESVCEVRDEEEFPPISVTYSIVGGFGLDIRKTVVFNPTAANDRPVISSDVNHHPFVKDGVIQIDLSADLALRGSQI